MLTEYNITRILVPTDFSATANIAIKHAVDIAHKFNSEITLLHVLEVGAYQGIFSPSAKTEFSEIEEAQLKLQEDAHQLEKETGINIANKVVTGKIYEQIGEAADKFGADLIVMGTHGVSGWEEFFVGSNAYKVVTQSDCPVLTVQEQATKENCKNIILPVDESAESRQKVKYAVALAEKYESTIHIATLISTDTEEKRHEFTLIVKQITDYLERKNIDYTETILKGDNLATMTMNFAEAKGGNLIVMMTEQEYNLTGFLMGPFAQQLVNHSKVPVLCISPEELGEGDSFHALG